MIGLKADVRHAIRLFLRTPILSLTAIVVLAVGMAFFGSFFSLYAHMVLRPIPGYEDSDRIATIGQNTGTNLVSIPFFAIEELVDQIPSIEAAAVWTGTTTLLGSDREPVITGMVSKGFFDGLRPKVAVGSGFEVDDHEADAAPVVVLTFSFWQQHFGADRGVLGQFIELAWDDSTQYRGPPAAAFTSEQFEPDQGPRQYRIIGILDREFAGLPGVSGEVFTPSVVLPLESAWSDFIGVPESLPLAMLRGPYVRRSVGASVTAVATDFRSWYERANSPFRLLPGAQLDAVEGLTTDISVYRDVVRQLSLFLAGSVLVALVAAANVSLFLLTRAPKRRRELAIRLAVGATISRIGRQLATEAAILVILATMLGIIVSIWLSLSLQGAAFFREANWQDATIWDWRVLGAIIALMLVLAFLVAISPIWSLRRAQINSSSGVVLTRASIAQRVAGMSQVAAATILGGVAIAFAWYLGILNFGNSGFEIDNRFYVRSGAQNAAITPEGRRVTAERWRNAVLAVPGISDIAFGDPIPGNISPATPRQIPDPLDASSTIDVYLGNLDDRFVDVLGMRLMFGRSPRSDESGVVVVNQTLARKMWGRDDVVGERIYGDRVFFGSEGSEVIGVLADVPFAHPSASPRSYAFRGFASFTSAIIESNMSSTELLDALTEISTELEIQILDLKPLRQLRKDLVASDRARAQLTMIAAFVVVFLAVFGFFGTFRYLIELGRREYAIRAAIGAGPGALQRLVFRRGFLVASWGIISGGLLAFICITWVRDKYLSAAISPVIVTLAVMGVFTTILFLAMLGPASVVTRSNPSFLLRQDT